MRPLFYHFSGVFLLAAIWWVGLSVQQRREKMTLLAPLEKVEPLLLRMTNEQLVAGIQYEWYYYPSSQSEYCSTQAQVMDSLFSDLPNQLNTLKPNHYRAFLYGAFVQIKTLMDNGADSSSLWRVIDIFDPVTPTEDYAETLLNGNPALFKQHFQVVYELAGYECLHYLAMKISSIDIRFDRSMPMIAARWYGNVGEYFPIAIFYEWERKRLFDRFLVDGKLLKRKAGNHVLDTVLMQPGTYPREVELSHRFGGIIKMDTIEVEIFGR